MATLRSRTPREVLNEIRFRRRASGEAPGGLGLDGVEVSILHRVGPESRPARLSVRGRDILRLERGFFYVALPEGRGEEHRQVRPLPEGRGEEHRQVRPLPEGRGETAIPYHRVKSILDGGVEVWKRP